VDNKQLANCITVVLHTLQCHKLPIVLTTASLQSPSNATNQLHRTVSRHSYAQAWHNSNGSVDHIESSGLTLAARSQVSTAVLLQCDAMTVGELFLTCQRCIAAACFGSKTAQCYDECMAILWNVRTSLPAADWDSHTDCFSDKTHRNCKRQNYRKLLQHVPEHVHNSSYYRTIQICIFWPQMYVILQFGIANKL
jgi:hypothetical protein